MNDILSLSKTEKIIFSLIFVFGVLVRCWGFGEIPRGLHQDELSNGLDAYYIANYQVDRNGVSLPVQFISWGDGQSALYGYFAVPGIKLFGLNPYTIRLPNLLAGILIIPLFFLIGKRLLDSRFGLLCMFLVAISPWSITGSRYGHEAYFVPFIFSLGFYLVQLSIKNSKIFLGAMGIFALCLYGYNTTFSTIPIFLGLTILQLFITKKISSQRILQGVGVFFVIAFPIILFALVNSLRWETIHISRLTMPRLPNEPRYEALVAIFKPDALNEIGKNLLVFLKLLWYQSDGWVRNFIPQYGYLYPLAQLFALVGLIIVVKRVAIKGLNHWSLVLGWFIAAFSIGVLQSANSNRISLIYPVLLIFIAVFLNEIINRYKIMKYLVFGYYLVYFGFFSYTYFSPHFLLELDKVFDYGLVESIEYSKQKPNPVCFYNKRSAYVYVLYVEKPHPREYLRKIGEIKAGQPFAEGTYLDKYYFKPDKCPMDSKPILIYKDPASVPKIPGYQISTTMGDYAILEPDI